ncbi:MAG: FAD:protein FMN transferase [Clostridia bacterium]|nr:FAD:protein FMN transferase [Clostridia bacterium]
MRKITLLFVTFCLILSIFAGCAPKEDVTRSFFAMDTYCSVTLPAGYEKTALEVEKRVKEIESLLSPFLPGSDVYKINAANGGGVTVSNETAELLRFGLTAQNGLSEFDVGLYNLSELWGFYGGEQAVPPSEKIAETLLKCGVKNAVFTDVNTVKLLCGVKIDLGGVAKGYAADEALEIIKKSGAPRAIVNLGGNVATWGLKANGKPFRVGVRLPYSQDGVLGVVESADLGNHFVTAGRYERFFVENGREYCHIIDPKTGYPVDNGLVSVTVLGAPAGYIADALSTAFFVMGLDRALEYIKNSGCLEAVFVTEDNKVIITKGLEGVFTLKAEGYTTEVAD